MAYTFYFSGVCFIVAVALALVVSFKGIICRNQLKNQTEEQTETESDNNYLSKA